MACLFSSLTLRETEIPNRVTVSPMCQYSCEEEDGLPTEWHRVHYGSLGVGGAGVVITEATAVEARGRISPKDLGIWTDEQGQALAPIASFLSEQGAIPAIQLAHAGRKASHTRPWDGGGPVSSAGSGWDVVAPSARPWPSDETPPETNRLTTEEIEAVVDSFRDGARRARNAGFEIAEIHAAHGYLIHEFLSPVTNHREDDYGGDFESRTRFAREVTAAVREEWPDDKPVFVRISATDWLDDRPSWTVDDSVRLADRLAEEGADLIDVSTGGIAPASSPPYTGPNFQVRQAERIDAETDADIAVGTVGGVKTPEQAEALVANDRADLVIVGREQLRDPYFALRAAEALDATDEVNAPPQYRRAFGF